METPEFSDSQYPQLQDTLEVLQSEQEWRRDLIEEWLNSLTEDELNSLPRLSSEDLEFEF